MSSTKVVILAGGRGTRLSEETHAVPKPMVRIGGRPILWHVMQHYASAGFTDFVVACGYRGYVIKEYFTNYFRHESDVTVDLALGKTQVLSPCAEDWSVTLIDTGLDTMTGGRLRRLAPYLQERFLMTYGDGLSNVPIEAVIRHHEANDALATVTAVSPPARFGVLELSGGLVRRFAEKPIDTGSRINGGFFVLEPEVLDLLADDTTVFEAGPLTALATSGRLAAYEHDGFWMPMDTVRDRDQLNALAQQETPPWVSA